MGRIIEGVWDCSYCGANKIRGSLRECPNCGHPRDKDITFYIDNPKNYVDTPINKNPDWLCPHCDCLNSDNDTVCKGCGASRDGSKNYFENKIEREAKQAEWQQLTKTPEPERPQKSINWKKIAAIAGISIAVLAVIAIFLAVFLPKTHTGTVTDISWNRTMEIEEYKTVAESDWTIPSGGRMLYSREEIRSYTQVLDHYETKTRTVQVLDHYEDYVSGHRDLGNGYFEEIISQRPVYVTKTETYEEPVYKSVPIFDTKYYYEIERWVHQSYKYTSGKDDTPYWSDYTCAENERFGVKSEKYSIAVSQDDKTYHCDMDYEVWKTLSIGQTITVKIHFGNHAEVITERNK